MIDWHTNLPTDWRTVEHGVRPRTAPRALIAVDVVSDNGTNVGDQHVARGAHAVLVYQDQLKAIASRVQTEEHQRVYNDAKVAFENELKEELKRDPEGARAKTSLSPEVFFAQRFPRGMPPIKAMKVLDPDVPPPDSPQARQEAEHATMASLVEQLTKGTTSTQEAIGVLAKAMAELVKRPNDNSARK